MDTLRIGVLGAARIVPMGLVRPAKSVDGVQVVAIASRDGARAEEYARRYGIARAYGDYDALLEDPDLDAVYLPLPNSLHAVWAKKALAAGHHVLCEKPLAANAVEASNLAEAAAQSGRILMEAFHWRYHPLAARMQELIRDGTLGRIVSLRARFRTPMLRREDIRFHYDLGGGAAMDLGCYQVNILRVVTGEEPVVEDAQAILLRPEVDKRMRARLKFPSGAHATLDCELGAWRWPQIDLHVECEEGSFFAVNPFLPQIYHSLRVTDRSGSRREWRGRTPTYVWQLRAFLEAVRSGRQPPSSAADGVLNMRVIDALYRAAGLSIRGLAGN